MAINVNLFCQLLTLLPKNSFSTLVKKHQSDKHTKGIDSWTHFVSMLFCHIGQANSVRDISNGLMSTTGNINHLGVERAPSKSTVSYVNANRDWHLFRDFYFSVLEVTHRPTTSFIKCSNSIYYAGRSSCRRLAG